MSGKHNAITPLRSFLTQEILPGMYEPLFKDMTDFIILATKTRGTKWFGKEVLNLRPLVTNQMKSRRATGVKPIDKHYHHYKTLVITRAKEMDTDEVNIKNILALFDVAFRKHELGEVFMDGLGGDLSKMKVTIHDLDQIYTCMKANGGKASVAEIIVWVQNIQE